MCVQLLRKYSNRNITLPTLYIGFIIYNIIFKKYNVGKVNPVVYDLQIAYMHAPSYYSHMYYYCNQGTRFISQTHVQVHTFPHTHIIIGRSAYTSHATVTMVYSKVHHTH